MNKSLAACSLVLVFVLLVFPVLPARAQTENTLRPQTGDIPLDAAHFPDENFRLYLKEYLELDGDILPYDLITETEELVVDGSTAGGITSLAGLEYFPFLQYLTVNDTAATSLALPGLSHLQWLDCSNNALETLQLEGCPALQELYCAGNDLQELALQPVRSLRVLVCGNNRLSALDAGGLASLATLVCSSNQLSSLSVAGCTGLRNLQCTDNRLPALDLSGVPFLSSPTSLGRQALSRTLASYNGATAQLDMAALAGAENTQKITFRASANTHYDAATGLLTLSGLDADPSPRTLAYSYNAGVIFTLEVFLQLDFTWDPPLESVSLPPAASLQAGQTLRLSPSFAPENAACRRVDWESDNPAVATVDAAGLVTGMAVGDTNIRLTTRDGGFTAACALSVTGAAVSGISVSPAYMELPPGGRVTLHAAVQPPHATVQQVTWQSSHPAVASVDGHGEVTAHQPGTAVIRATTQDGGFTADCRVLCAAAPTSSPAPSSSLPVSPPTSTPPPASSASRPPLPEPEPPPAAEPALTLSPAALTLKPGSRATLRAACSSGADADGLRWKSSRPKLVSVSAGGLLRAAKTAARGSAVITVTAKATGQTARCTVRIGTPVQSIRLRAGRTLQTGKKMSVRASLHPQNATNRKITWASSNASVVSVSASGQVEGRKPGTATITAITQDGEKTSRLSITVKPGVKSVRMNLSSLTMRPGGQVRLKAAVQPANAIDTAVVWKSSNPKVATVTSGGLVKAAPGATSGRAVITATSRSGRKTARCTVHIAAPPPKKR